VYGHDFFVSPLGLSFLAGPLSSMEGLKFFVELICMWIVSWLTTPLAWPLIINIVMALHTDLSGLLDFFYRITCLLVPWLWSLYLVIVEFH
jgi:hypothetical protein